MANGRVPECVHYKYTPCSQAGRRGGWSAGRVGLYAFPGLTDAQASDMQAAVAPTLSAWPGHVPRQQERPADPERCRSQLSERAAASPLVTQLRITVIGCRSSSSRCPTWRMQTSFAKVW